MDFLAEVLPDTEISEDDSDKLEIITDDLEMWVFSEGVKTIKSSVLGSSVLCKAVECSEEGGGGAREEEGAPLIQSLERAGVI